MKVTVEDQYVEWWRQIGLPNATSTQKNEMKKSFYSGAAAMLNVMNAVVGGAPEEKAAAMIEELDQELRLFFHEGIFKLDSQEEDE